MDTVRDRKQQVRIPATNFRDREVIYDGVNGPKKARIVREDVGVKTYYYAQIQDSFLWVFKVWSSMSGVSLNTGKTYWYKQLSSYGEALKNLRNYEELYGEKLQIEGLNPDFKED